MTKAFSVLRPCTAIWGACEIVHEDPALTEVKDVMTLPYVPGEAWGIFNRSGHIIMEAVDRHGPEGILVDRKFIASDRLLVEKSSADGRTYIYGGFVNLHFGHFIVNTLPRLWPLVRGGIGSHQLLFHGQASPADWFGLPFIRDFFTSLEITQDKIRFVDQPLLISRLIIPHPSFQEQHFAHRVFGKLCRKIGAKLLKDSAVSTSRNCVPAYLSKSRLTSGVGRFANEKTLTDILRENGVEIVYPELMSLAEQVKIFSSRDTILGTLGSAFHNSVFSRPQAKIVCISPSFYPNSNFIMMDKLSGANVQYFYAPGTEISQNGNPSFHTDLELPHPTEIAKDLLHLLDK